MTRYGVEMYACDNCGHYPISILQELAPHWDEVKDKVADIKEGVGYDSPETHPSCPRCGSYKTHFEKVYEADETGRIIE